MYNPFLLEAEDVVEPFEGESFFMPRIPPVVPPTTAARITKSRIEPTIHLSRLLP